MFYRDVGAHLIWVLASFSEDYRRMTTDDLLFSNNSNVFVVDEETVRLSEEAKRFHLRCHYRIPFCNAGSISDKCRKPSFPLVRLKKKLSTNAPIISIMRWLKRNVLKLLTSNCVMKSSPIGR
jgi:hypothetical protein